MMAQKYLALAFKSTKYWWTAVTVETLATIIQMCKCNQYTFQK